MRWQQVLGVLLGLLVVGPLVTGVIGRDQVGLAELLLGGLIGAAVGYAVASRWSAEPERG